MASPIPSSNLPWLLPEKGFHVARALVGSESTCATVLEATLRLVPSPSHRALVVLGFIDYFHQVLPDAVTMPGLVLALVYSIFRDDLSFRGALLGAVAGAGFLLQEMGIK